MIFYWLVFDLFFSFRLSSFDNSSQMQSHNEPVNILGAQSNALVSDLKAQINLLDFDPFGQLGEWVDVPDIYWIGVTPG